MIQYLQLNDSFRPVIRQLLVLEWGGPMIVTKGNLFDASVLPGIVAVEGNQLLGCLLYQTQGCEFEVVMLQSIEEHCGIGTHLMNAAVDMAKKADCTRLWLITTNDNTTAIRFYQRYGMHLAAAHIGSMISARESLKPTIPLLGADDIPIRDELELELLL